MDRRAFIGAFAAAGLGGYGLSACAGNTGSAATRLDRIGVQLYTVRDRMREDVGRTLGAVAAIGYQEVETAGLHDLSPAQFRAEMDRAGLTSPAGHYGMNDLRQSFETILTTASVLGQQWVVVPSLDGADRSPDGYRRVADEMNRFGALCRERGLRLAYHNHDFEFVAFDDPRTNQRVTGYDLLLAGTDPALVEMELDLFWAVKGGQDPVTIFRQNSGRFPLCHVKDMAEITGAQRMTEVGQGEIDFARILRESELAGLRHFFVEHDTPEDSFASIETSHDYLRTTF